MAIPMRYNWLNLFARPANTIASILLIALIIAVFAYLQAVTSSAIRTMVASGDPNTIIVLRQGADSETVSGLSNDELNKLELTPKILSDDQGAIISPELVGISSGADKSDPEVKLNSAVRGVRFDAANRVRHGRVAIIEGRVFQEGTFEVIVGQSARNLFQGYEIGDEIEIGTRGIRKFKIVGVFSTGGTSADTEVWGYLETLRDVYGRNGYSSARLLVEGEQDAQAAIEYIKGPNVQLSAKTERAYFRSIQTEQKATQVLSLIMIVIMGIAASFAVANTMYSAVAGRTREIGMLRAIGFGKWSVMTSFILEGLLLTLLGGLLGCGLSFLSNGMQKNMLPTTFTTVSYSLRITPEIVLVSLACALAIGFAGSLLPAWRASKIGVIEALRES